MLDGNKLYRKIQSREATNNIGMGVHWKFKPIIREGITKKVRKIRLWETLDVQMSELQDETHVEAFKWKQASCIGGASRLISERAVGCSRVTSGQRVLI